MTIGIGQLLHSSSILHLPYSMTFKEGKDKIFRLLAPNSVLWPVENFRSAELEMKSQAFLFEKSIRVSFLFSKSTLEENIHILSFYVCACKVYPSKITKIACNVCLKWKNGISGAKFTVRADPDGICQGRKLFAVMNDHDVLETLRFFVALYPIL